jgi:hypothetical protein
MAPDDAVAAVTAVPPPASAPPDGGPRPPVVTAIALGLWARAALRLPLMIFLLYYLAHGVEIAQRSGEFPDGATLIWLLYALSEPDNYLWVPLATLVDGHLGAGGMTTWLIGYLVMTVGYVVAGFLVWRGSPVVRRGYRAGVVGLGLGAVFHLLTLIAVVPGALDAVRTGENAPGDHYPGEEFIHAYEWILLPWAIALTAVAVALPLLLRTSSGRHLRMDEMENRRDGDQPAHHPTA